MDTKTPPVNPGHRPYALAFLKWARTEYDNLYLTTQDFNDLYQTYLESATALDGAGKPDVRTSAVEYFTWAWSHVPPGLTDAENQQWFDEYFISKDIVKPTPQCLYLRLAYNPDTHTQDSILTTVTDVLKPLRIHVHKL